jgi:hypothetical protein
MMCHVAQVQAAAHGLEVAFYPEKGCKTPTSGNYKDWSMNVTVKYDICGATSKCMPIAHKLKSYSTDDKKVMEEKGTVDFYGQIKHDSAHIHLDIYMGGTSLPKAKECIADTKANPASKATIELKKDHFTKLVNNECVEVRLKTSGPINVAANAMFYAKMITTSDPWACDKTKYGEKKKAGTAGTAGAGTKGTGTSTSSGTDLQYTLSPMLLMMMITFIAKLEL